MKYLKLFESIEYEEINGRAFTELVYGEFEIIGEERDRWITDNWSKEERIDKIQKILTKKYNTFNLDFRVDGKSISLFPKVNRERPHIPVPFFAIRVYCLRDEWYCLTTTGMKNGRGNLFYKCDQFDGLKKCIKSL